MKRLEVFFPKFIIILVVILMANRVFAQQDQQYSMYMINQFVLNPAIAGTEDFIDVNLGYRKQWTGFEGSPLTYYVSAHGTVGKTFGQYHRKGEHKAWHGIGMQAFQDQTGPLKRTSFLLAYAYNFAVSTKTRLSVGTYFGFKQLTTNRDYWKNIDDTSDDLFRMNLNTGLKPDLHAGAALYNPAYFVNLSVFQLLGTKLDLVENGNTSQSKLNRHVYLNGGVKLPLSRTTEIMPSVMIKYVMNAPLSVDLNVKATFDKKYWVGGSYRALESVNAFVGLNVMERVDVSYAYEWSLTKIKKYNYGTHEIIIGLRLRHSKNIVCPSRFW